MAKNQGQMEMSQQHLIPRSRTDHTASWLQVPLDLSGPV